MGKAGKHQQELELPWHMLLSSKGFRILWFLFTFVHGGVPNGSLRLQIGLFQCAVQIFLVISFGTADLMMIRGLNGVCYGVVFLFSGIMAVLYSEAIKNPSFPLDSVL